MFAWRDDISSQDLHQYLLGPAVLFCLLVCSELSSARLAACTSNSWTSVDSVNLDK